MKKIIFINLFITTLAMIMIAGCKKSSDEPETTENPITPPNPTVEQVKTPTFSTPPGTYETEFYLTIECATDSAIIYYTIDGTDPNDSTSNIYEFPFEIYENITVKAKAYKKDFKASEIASASYVMNLEKVAMPTFSLEEGSYNSQQNVEITCATPNAEIRYTFNGSDPDENSLLYQSKIIVRKTMTIKAKAFKRGHESSDINTVNYTIENVCDGKINIKGIDYTITGVNSASSVFGTFLTFNTMAEVPYVKISFKDSSLPIGEFIVGENNDYCTGFVSSYYNNVANDYYISDGGVIKIEYDEEQNLYTITIPEVTVVTSGTGHQLNTTLSLNYHGSIL